MENLTIEKVMIDLKTQKQVHMTATIKTEPDEIHKIYSLTFEGYRSDWNVA